VLQEVYPGRELKDEEQRFMTNLKGCIRKLRNRVMGDVTAEFGKERGCSPNVGKHSLNEKRDDNVWKRIE
jgi:hypothetical protein